MHITGYILLHLMVLNDIDVCENEIIENLINKPSLMVHLGW